MNIYVFDGRLFKGAPTSRSTGDSLRVRHYIPSRAAWAKRPSLIPADSRPATEDELFRMTTPAEPVKPWERLPAPKGLDVDAAREIAAAHGLDAENTSAYVRSVASKAAAERRRQERIAAERAEAERADSAREEAKARAAEATAARESQIKSLNGEARALALAVDSALPSCPHAAEAARAYWAKESERSDFDDLFGDDGAPSPLFGDRHYNTARAAADVVRQEVSTGGGIALLAYPPKGSGCRVIIVGDVDVSSATMSRVVRAFDKMGGRARWKVATSSGHLVLSVQVVSAHP